MGLSVVGGYLYHGLYGFPHPWEVLGEVSAGVGGTDSGVGGCLSHMKFGEISEVVKEGGISECVMGDRESNSVDDRIIWVSDIG